VLADQDASQDVAASSVGEGVEQRVGPILLGMWSGDNHDR
jgi:hypothetical protein